MPARRARDHRGDRRVTPAPRGADRRAPAPRRTRGCRARERSTPAAAQPATRYRSRATSAFVHEGAEARPRRHDLDRKRSAQHAPDDHAVDREHRLERQAQRVTPDDARARAAARDAPRHRGFVERFLHRLRLQSLERWPRSAAPAPAPEATRYCERRHDRCRVARDGKPPTGNHPVRAASSSSTNDVTSGGTETQHERQRAGDGRRGVAAAAGDDAGRNADQRRQQQRRHAEQRRLPRALGHELLEPAGRYLTDSPRSRRTARPSQLAVPHEQRPIESQTMRARPRRPRGRHRTGRTYRQARPRPAARPPTRPANTSSTASSNAAGAGSARSPRCTIGPCREPPAYPRSTAAAAPAATGRRVERRGATSRPSRAARRNRSTAAPRRGSAAPRRTRAAALEHRAAVACSRISSSIRRSHGVAGLGLRSDSRSDRAPSSARSPELSAGSVELACRPK